jgi:3-oxoisoapionate decarboxylase
LRLGVHTFCFNMHGLGQGWAGFDLPWGRQLSTVELFDKLVELGLDGVHLDDAVLESLDSSYLREVKAAADERGLYIEYNLSMDWDHRQIGIQHDIGDGVEIAHHLGADVVKVGMDMVRPRPISGSRFHPQIMERLEVMKGLLKQHARRAAECGVRIAVENHTDLVSDELLWLLDQVDEPNVGACIDTVNAFHAMENPMDAIEKLAPRAFTNHFRDDRIEFEIWGFRLTGCAVGEGDIDVRRAYELIRDTSQCERINIETDLDIPMDDMREAMRTEQDALVRSIRYCRDVLGVGSEEEGRNRSAARLTES